MKERETERERARGEENLIFFTDPNMTRKEEAEERKRE